MSRRFSRPGAALASAALLLGLAVALAGAGPAQAAASRGGKAESAQTHAGTPDAAKAQAAQSRPTLEHAAGHADAAAATDRTRAAYSKAGPGDAAGCFAARRKLWVEGEGWIVRRVTTCR